MGSPGYVVARGLVDVSDCTTLLSSAKRQFKSAPFHRALRKRADRRRQRVLIRHTAHVVEILQIFQIDRQIDVPAQLFFTDLAPMRKQQTS